MSGGYLLYLQDKAKYGSITQAERAMLRRCSKRARISYNISPKKG